MITERRQHNRIDVSWKARLLKKGVGVAGSTVENVSIGGVLVRTTLKLELRDHVLLEFETSDKSSPRRIVCECELVRSIPEADPARFNYGLRFHRIKDDDIGYLLMLIAQRWHAGEPDR